MTTIPAEAVALARSRIGDPYEWGEEGPTRFDCSGLVWWAYWHAGLHWTRTTADVEITRGISVPRSGLLPGDLVQPILGHIQIYSGKGRVIEAPHTGADVREVAMWGFLRACRVVKTPAPAHIPYPGHYVMEGSRGSAVRAVQAKVGTPVDGIFGPHTKAAVERFQHAHHLQVDGIVGPLTWRAIFG